MKRKDAFPSAFTGKDDLAGPLVVTIDYVDMQDVQGDNGKESKPVMHFTDGVKPFILNNVNWQTCEDAYGDDSDNWRGKRVELYVDPTIMFGNKRVGGVRIRLPDVAQRQPAPANGTPFVWLLEEAISACIAEGITKPELIDRLKQLGCTSYNPQRDTAKVKQFIEEMKASAEFNALPSAQEVPL